MNLFSLVARLGLDTSGYEKGIGSAMAKGVLLGNMLTDLVKKGVSMGKSLVGTGLTYNQQMEDYTTNFKVMLGSLTAAESKVEELKVMAAKTPFEMQDLAGATQTLLAFGVESSKTSKVMSQLGDISLGNAQRFQSLSNAYGKAAAQGKLTGEVVQMMVDAGFNPLLLIAQETGEAMTDLQKRMSAGRVSVDELDLALRRATGEGGQFYKGMEEASKTMSGQLSTLSDNWNAFLGEAMSPVSEQLSSKILPKAIESLDKLSAALFGVKGDAEGAKKALFLNSEGEKIDPSANLLTWVQDLMAEWTNGVVEDDATIAAYVKQFNENTDSIKAALNSRLMDTVNPLTPMEAVEFEAKKARISQLQTEVTLLLQKRAGGYFTAEDETRLNEILTLLDAMQIELENSADFESNVVSPWERLISVAGDTSAGAIEKVTDLIIKAGENPETVKEVLIAAGALFAGLKGMAVGGAMGGPVGALVGLLTGAAGVEAVTHWNDIVDKFKELANMEWEMLQSGLQGVADAIEEVKEWWDGIGDSVEAALGLEDDFFTKTVPEAWKNNFVAPIENAFSSVANWIDSCVAKLETAISKVKEFFRLSDRDYTVSVPDKKSAMMAGAAGYTPEIEDGSHATGLDYVPYNEYRAILHEGEAVLTKAEARRWRGGETAEPAQIDYGRMAAAFVSALSHAELAFNVNGRTLAYATAGDNARAANDRARDINIGKVRG